MKVMRKILEEKIGELEEELFIRGNLNARIGLEGQNRRCRKVRNYEKV